MDSTRTPKAGDDLHALPRNNPLVPPTGDACFINSLPPELLSRIFEAGDEGDNKNEDDMGFDFCDGDSDAMGSSEPDIPVFPIVVSRVCHHWRNVASSTPILWTSIFVPPQARPPYKRVSVWLERSKDVLIDIYLSSAPPDKGDCDVEPPCIADLRFLLSMLTPHVHRWRTMEVTVSAYSHMYVLLSAVSDPSILAAPQLRTLELYDLEDEFDWFPYSTMLKHFILFGGSAPLLTKVVLWGVHVDWNQPWIASASNLTDLQLSFLSEDVRPTWTQFSTILRSSLKNLTLRKAAPSGDPTGWFIEPSSGSPPDLNTPITLSNVRDFVLEDISEKCATALLHKLYLPALRHLTLAFYDEDYSEFVRELVKPSPSREQSHGLLSQLESLRITELPCDVSCIQTLFAELQNLVSLKVSTWFLCELFLDIRVDVWLPRLATLCVFGPGTPRCGKVLRVLVRVRRDAGVPLTSLYIEKCCRTELEMDDEQWLKKNVETFRFVEEM